MGQIGGRRTPGPGTGAALAFILAGAALATPVQADPVDLDLYEKVALAPLVVLGRVDGDPGRMADVRVLEVFKGEYSAPRLEVAYRLINFERPYGQDKIAFEAGEEAILFLLPLENSRGKNDRPDRFILFKGPDGKMSLPREGRQVWIDATRRLAEVAAIKDSQPLFDALRALVAEENPLLVEIGLRQVHKHRLADESLVPRVLEMVRRPDGRFRAEALDLASDLLRNPPREARPLSERDHLLSLASAILDEAPEVATRRAAVRLLASDGTPAARAKLEAISAADPSQDVRYEAALAVYRLMQAQPARMPTP